MTTWARGTDGAPAKQTEHICYYRRVASLPSTDRLGPEYLGQADLFPLGRLVVTARIVDEEDRAEVFGALHRHRLGDWGDLPPADKVLNEAALRAGERVLSRYVLSTGTVAYIITEADRSSTMVLRDDEY